MMEKTYEIITLGCKVNEYESQYYAEQMEAIGLKPCSLFAGFEKPSESENEKDEEDRFSKMNSEKTSPAKTNPVENLSAKKGADVIIINTCTVTNMAAKKSRQKIHKARRENPDALCVVVGCYVQTMEDSVRKDLGADLMIGALHKSEIGQKVRELLEKKEPVSLVVKNLKEVSFENMPIGSFEGRNRAFLKIQDGCNQYCAYCQIPFARGPERSAQISDIISTAKNLNEKGYQEIVLTGIHTGRYQDGSEKLSDLLKMLLENTDESLCFRISSIEITEVSDELIELMAENPRILKHLHIPIQAASNETLKRMKRPYSVEQFSKRLSDIRNRLPECSVSTDVICGFVGESDEEFADGYENLKRLGFSFLHVFPYSRRKGTAADSMKGFIQDSVIKKRTKELLELSKELRKEDLKRFTKGNVLIERKDDQGFYHGYTEQYHPVIIQSDHPLKGRVMLELEAEEDGYFAKAGSEE